jgi:hypothetical protein
MPTISNPYTSPEATIGASLEALGNSMWGPQAAAAEFAKQKATDARRVNVSKEALANAVRMNNGNFDPSNPDVAASVVGLDDPRKFFQGVQGLTANRYGASDPRTTNSMLGAGESYGATPQGVGAQLGNARTIAQMQTDKILAAERYKADTTPINVLDQSSPTGYKTVSKADAIRLGLPQVLGDSEATGALKIRGFQSGYAGNNDEQNKAAGVYTSPDKVQNYALPGPDGQPVYGRTIDGKVDMTTNRPIPPHAIIINPANAGGTNAFSGALAPNASMANDLRGRIASNKQLEDLTAHAMGLVKNDPTIVGAPGVAQRFGQNALTAATDVAKYLGKGQDLQQSIQNIQQEAAQKLGPNAIRLLPELYKPQINELEAIHAIITYKAAESLFGQSGRDLSDRDVAGARAMVGDPNSLFESSRSFMEKMNTINHMAAAQRKNAESILQTNNVTQGTPVVPPAQAAAPAAVAPAGGGDILAEAKAAIAKGADPAKVMQRIQTLLMGNQPAPTGP